MFLQDYTNIQSYHCFTNQEWTDNNIICNDQINYINYILTFIKYYNSTNIKIKITL